MKQIIITILSAIMCWIGCKGELGLIRENSFWSYEVVQFTHSNNPPFEGVLLFFADSETINGKEYKYLNCMTSVTSFLQLRDLTFKYGNVDFLYVFCAPYVPDNSVTRLFLMREEGNKIYMYNDRNHNYTEPIHSICTHLDLSMQTDELPEEIVLYDFDANVGDSFNSIVFEKDGRPTIAIVKVLEREERNLDVLKSPVVDQLLDYNTSTGISRKVETNSLLGRLECFFSGFAASYRLGYLLEFCSPRHDIKYNMRDNIIEITPYFSLPYAYQFEVYFKSDKNDLTRYKVVPDYDSEIDYTYCLNKEINSTWSKDYGSDLSIDRTVSTLLKFRKENGVVYVKPNPEWIDAETGLPFEEDTELVYADMNVREGDMFPTFVVEDNVVTCTQKKVRFLTCAILPDKSQLYALVFCDENGEIDHTMWYIDGIGFYGPEAGVTVFNGGRLNNIYDSEGNVIVEGENIQIPDYVKIGEVNAAAASDVIYTIEGLRVNGNVSEFPAGLYIINGRKVAVRK